MVTLLDGLAPDAANIVGAGCKKTVGHGRADK